MQKYTAIILSHYDVGEFDRIYIMYTLESGLVKAIGRGVRKPAAKLAGHLEPGTLSEVYVAKARGRGQIASAITIENFEGIKKNLEKLQAVIGVLNFFARKFSEGEKDKKTFDLLGGFLKVLDGETKKTDKEKEKLIILAFWWKLFDRLGQWPEAARCVSCGEKLRGQSPAFSSPTFSKVGDSSKPDFRNFFSVEKGGVVCPQCALERKGLFDISDNQIKLLRLFLANPLVKILKIKVGGEEIRGLERMKENFLRFYFA